MSAASNYLENALINAVLRNTSYTSPTTVYVALHTLDPGETGTGGELSGNGYSRQPAVFNAPSDGATANSSDISWTANGGNWGTISHISVWDALSGGNCLFTGALGTSRTVNDGDTLTIPAGDLDITLQ